MAGYSDTSATQSKVTLRTFIDYKERGDKFAVLTAYDASFAKLVEQAGVELILVGDSLGMVIQGHDTTIPVSMDHMVYHTRCVSRACERAMVMADMPFMSYANAAEAVRNAARLLQDGGAQCVKLEGGAQQVDVVKAIAEQGIPVCAHLGLRPQSVHKLGGFRVQGRDAQAAEQMLRDAQSLQQAGADLLLLECVPVQLAQRLCEQVQIPVIGIGAGPDTDAQVLVLQDILGITHGKVPRFSKNFMAGAESIGQAVERFVAAVRNGEFPAPEHTFT